MNRRITAAAALGLTAAGIGAAGTAGAAAK